MHLMADALMKYETIDSDQIDQIMEEVPDAPTAGQTMIVVLQAKMLMLHLKTALQHHQHHKT